MVAGFRAKNLPQLSQREGFDLPGPFARESQQLPYLL
jgi:hypothetical protein